MPSSASCSRRRAFSAFSIDRMVSPIVAPSYDPDLRVHEDLEPRKATAAQLFVRAARAPVLIRVRAVRRWVEVRLGVDVDRARDRRPTCIRRSGCATRRPDRSARRARRSGCTACRPTAWPSSRSRAIAETPSLEVEVVEDRLGHEQVGRPRRRAAPRARPSEARRRARGRRRGGGTDLASLGTGRRRSRTDSRRPSPLPGPLRSASDRTSSSTSPPRPRAARPRARHARAPLRP